MDDETYHIRDACSPRDETETSGYNSESPQASQYNYANCDDDSKIYNALTHTIGKKSEKKEQKILSIQRPNVRRLYYEKDSPPHGKPIKESSMVSKRMPTNRSHDYNEDTHTDNLKEPVNNMKNAPTLIRQNTFTKESNVQNNKKNNFNIYQNHADDKDNPNKKCHELPPEVYQKPEISKVKPQLRRPLSYPNSYSNTTLLLKSQKSPSKGNKATRSPLKQRAMTNISLKPPPMNKERTFTSLPSRKQIIPPKVSSTSIPAKAKSVQSSCNKPGSLPFKQQKMKTSASNHSIRSEVVFNDPKRSPSCSQIELKNS